MKSNSWPIRARAFLITSLVAGGALALALQGCAKDTESKSPKGNEATQTTQQATPAGTDVGATLRIPDMGAVRPDPALGGGAQADTSYSINLEAPKTLDKGTEGVVRVNVVPGTGWKMNKEFPLKLQVKAPEGVTLAKDKQSLEDAEKFEDKGATFAVKFKADSPGQKSFEADFRFAVCTDATCDPKRQTLAWVVDVQ
jgi:hypothetical protein